MDTLKNLGWDESRHAEFDKQPDKNLSPARVASAVSGRYRLLGMGEPVWAVARGKLSDPESHGVDWPAVGDWVLARREGETVVVEQVLPRRSVFMRKAAGKTSHAQVIAANLDRVFIVTDVCADFNPRRIERYLTTVWDGGAEPVIVLNKTDLPHDRTAIQIELDAVALGVPVLFVSAESQQGLEDLFALCGKGKTIAFVGSSGVGKSTIINRLIGQEKQKTAAIRSKDEKGRHTTTRQELIITSTAAMLIDTPGIRELGLVEQGEGLERAFADLLAYAQNCRFRDCKHESEPGCAVREAIERGEIKPERLDSYHRLQRELEFNTWRGDQRGASANSKKRWKDLSKIVREFNVNRR